MKKTYQEKRMRILLPNMLIVFILASLAAFLVDGWVLHPIPRQSGFFDLRLSGTQYADALIIEKPGFSDGSGEVLLVEQEGEMHMLYFSRHRMSGRYALVSDVIVEPNYTGGVKIGTKLSRRVLIMENGKIVNSSGGVQLANNPGYLLVGMIVTAAESALLWQFLKKKYPME